MLIGFVGRVENEKTTAEAVIFSGGLDGTRTRNFRRDRAVL